MASPTIHADETLKALSRYLAGHPRVLWRFPRQEWTGKVWELGRLPCDSQELIGNLPHAGKTSYLSGQLNTDDFKLVKRGSGVLRSYAVCLSNAGVEESHVGLVTGGQGRVGNGQLSKQGVVLQTWCGENSTPWHDDRLRFLGVREKT